MISHYHLKHPAKASRIKSFGFYSLLLSSLYTRVSKTMWIGVNNAYTKLYRFCFVDSPSNPSHLYTSYPHAQNCLYRLKKQMLKKSVDRLSTYTQCLL